MKLFIRANDATYRAAINVEANEGRLPPAWLTIGYVSGLGWSFLGPWAQLALFPEKGTLAASGNTHRHHEPFIVLRYWPNWSSQQHRNCDWEIRGRYWHGLVWRRRWGKRFGIPKFRKALLDPDIVTDDPGKADDWGDKPGEDW